MPITTAVPNRKSDTASCSLECNVTSFSTARYRYDDVNALRRQSDELPGSLGNSMLRHSDEQTLSALVAVRDAISKYPSRPDFNGWGVVCSTRYLGRSAFAQALTKFAVDGPWNVSVQVVPNRSLHSPASMIGLALGCHGPCVGVGGGRDGETDAWMTALTLLDQQKLPGMWLVFSGWEPDKRIDVEGEPLAATDCTALALALQPVDVGGGQARLRIVYDCQMPSQVAIPAKQTAMSMFDDFTAAGIDGTCMTALLGGGLRAEMEWLTAAESTLPMPAPIPAIQRKAA